jgi:hypothetical protein
MMSELATQSCSPSGSARIYTIYNAKTSPQPQAQACYAQYNQIERKATTEEILLATLSAGVHLQGRWPSAERQHRH